MLNMFVGVVVENFHKCRESQEQEERARRINNRVKGLLKKRKSSWKLFFNLSFFSIRWIATSSIAILKLNFFSVLKVLVAINFFSMSFKV